MIDLGIIRAQIERVISSNPDLADDEELRSDMLEGCTDIDQVLDRLVEAEADAATMVAAIDERISNLEERGARYTKRSQVAREMIMTVLSAADLRKFTLPTATVSVRDGAQRLVEIDGTQTPAEFTKTVTEPVKADIKRALSEGTAVPGWSLSNGSPSVTIRRK